VLSFQGVCDVCILRCGRRHMLRQHPRYLPRRETGGCHLGRDLLGSETRGWRRRRSRLQGAYYTAKACLACHVPKLAFISAGCVTRPNALGSRAVNVVATLSYGDYPWVDAKMAGEAAVRDLCQANKKKNLSYVIVRPAAALSDKPPVTVDQLLVPQGDVYSSAASLSRTNVAHTVVHVLLKGRATDGRTFELSPAVRLYRNEEGNVLDLCGLSSRHQASVPHLPQSLVHRNAASYDGLLEELVTDQDMLHQYGSIVNDYRGKGLPSVLAFS
jgi:hypothetical protein